MPSVITLDITDGNIPSVMFPRETFFWRACIHRRCRRCFRRWVFFLFATELATEMGFTDDCYTDGRDPSVTPSVLLLPTECIDVTDGISPSAKLYNVVVFAQTLHESADAGRSSCLQASFLILALSFYIVLFLFPSLCSVLSVLLTLSLYVLQLVPLCLFRFVLCLSIFFSGSHPLLLPLVCEFVPFALFFFLLCALPPPFAEAFLWLL